MQETLNYKLKKPEQNDYVNVQDLNYNADIIDTKLKENESQLADMTQQIQNIDLSADKVIVNNSNLNSKDVNSALTELFTFADNGKKNWVDVIGSPLLNTDSFSTLKSKTQTLKNTFASNLNDKKVSASGTEGLNSLINKIKNIDTGLKYATGNIVDRFAYPNKKMIISNLNFRPSTVIIFIKDKAELFYLHSSMIDDNIVNIAIDENGIVPYGDGNKRITVNDNGFDCKMYSDDYTRTYYWIAIGK